MLNILEIKIVLIIAKNKNINECITDAKIKEIMDINRMNFQ